MNTIAKVSLVCAFTAATGFGFKYALQDLIATKSPPPQMIATGEICSATKVPPKAESSLAAQIPTPVIAATVPADETLDAGEELVRNNMPMHHHPERELVSTVDIAKALAMAGQGNIGFVEGLPTATITVMDNDGVTSHDYTFGFEGKGAICDENSPVCTTMDTIPQEDKARLTTTICERAKGTGGESFYQQVCTPKP